MAEATDAFYRRQAKLLEEEGDERCVRARVEVAVQDLVCGGGWE